VIPTGVLEQYLDEAGLTDNGRVPIYMDAPQEPEAGADDEGRTDRAEHELRSISWRLLEDLGVGIAAYNDPKAMHCLSPNQQMETFMVLEHARRDPRVKALVWTGTGTRAFCSGAALKGDQTVHVPRDVVKTYGARGMAPSGDWVLSAQVRAFWDFPKPLLFAVNGLAVGGGANIALASFGDLVFCSTKARFMYPFVKLGITPELGSSLVLPWLVGMSKAKEMMMLGNWFSADEALRLNLVNAVCSPEELLPRAVQTAAEIGTRHPTTLRLMKQIMNAPLRGQLDAVLKVENQALEESVRASGGFAKNSKLVNSKL